MIYLLILLIPIILAVFFTIKYREEIVKKRIYRAMYICALPFFLISYVVNSIRIVKWGDWHMIVSLLLLRDIEKGALYGFHSLGYIFLASAVTGSLCAAFNMKHKKNEK
jgi:hypothetical protein